LLLIPIISTAKAEIIGLNYPPENKFSQTNPLLRTKTLRQFNVLDGSSRAIALVDEVNKPNNLRYVANPEQAILWEKWPKKRLRGVTIKLVTPVKDRKNYDTFPSDETFKKLSEWKVNVIRVHIDVDKGSLWDIKKGNNPPIVPPFDNLAPYKKHLKGLEIVLNLAHKYSIYVIVTAGNIVGRNTDITNQERKKWENYQKILTDIWSFVASRFGDHASLIGYDLLNEPVYRKGDNSWQSEIVPHLIRKIRELDRETFIIVEPGPWGLPGSFEYFKPVSDKKTLYSFHFYAPHNYTHQGVRGRPRGLEYPGLLRNFNSSPMLYWDKEQLNKSVKVARDFQIRHNVKIFIGEFSAIRWGPGASRWIEDSISIFEGYGWDWCFHSYGGWNGWNPTFAPNDSQSNESEGGKQTDRLKVLIKAWNKNQH
jgi:hypothetical protein